MPARPINETRAVIKQAQAPVPSAAPGENTQEPAPDIGNKRGGSPKINAFTRGFEHGNGCFSQNAGANCSGAAAEDAVAWVGDYRPGSAGDHLRPSPCDDAAGASKDSFGVRSPPDKARDTAGLVYLNLLVVLERVLISPDLRDDGIAQAESLVAMLLHIFDIDIITFWNVDRAN